VLESLNGTFLRWAGRGNCLTTSSAGRRSTDAAVPPKCAEVARTLQDVDVEPTMALATAARQDWLIDAMTSKGLAYSSLGSPFSWRELRDWLTKDT